MTPFLRTLGNFKNHRSHRRVCTADMCRFSSHASLPSILGMQMLIIVIIHFLPLTPGPLALIALPLPARTKISLALSVIPTPTRLSFPPTYPYSVQLGTNSQANSYPPLNHIRVSKPLPGFKMSPSMHQFPSFCWLCRCFPFQTGNPKCKGSCNRGPTVTNDSVSYCSTRFTFLPKHMIRSIHAANKNNYLRHVCLLENH